MCDDCGATWAHSHDEDEDDNPCTLWVRDVVVTPTVEAAA